jgi:hypothetical protein
MHAQSQHHPSLARTARLAVPLLALSLLTDCHSLAGIRVDQRVHAGDRSAELALWCRRSDSILSDGEMPVYEAFVALLLYPVDVIASTCVAVSAPFDDRLEVRGGPVGALAGICLPWVTLVPYVYPPFHLMVPPKELELTPAEFDLLLQRVQAGDGAATYRELGRATGLGELVYAVDWTR